MIDVARRRAVVAAAVVCGSVLFVATLHVERDSGAFFAAGYGLAAVWFVAAALVRPVVVGGSRSVAQQVGIGVSAGIASYGVFVAGAAVGKHISFLAGPIHELLGRADATSVAAVLGLALANGVAEELFFRGGMPSVIEGRWSPALAVAIYVGVTATAGNTALTVAALVMGVVFMVERTYTKGLVASITTHLVWTTLVILALPR